MKNRIDKEIVARGFVPSRSKAQELINSDFIKCNGKVINKCNYLVDNSDCIEIITNDRLKYVSRGGLKLEKAITEFKIDFTDKFVMDIGSSTGGFCDCALQHGAKRIIAIDVGTDLLHDTLRKNSKIELHEQTNFKELEHKYFQNIDIITCDVSFISLKKIIEKIKQEQIKADIICLIKPQFECGKEIADKYKGIILNEKIHFEIISDLINH
ncbi:MAG: TlyA family RNA methyltransferase, partial [bacterium]|nr:TlyA family RNA methyltransferase [bacterium]